MVGNQDEGRGEGEGGRRRGEGPQREREGGEEFCLSFLLILNLDNTISNIDKMTTRYRIHWPVALKRSSEILHNQNLRHAAPFQMAIRLEI